MARRLLLLAVIAAVLGFAPSAFAADITITQSTTLTADQSGTIFVGADNITLDCAGHTISSSAFAAIDLTNRTGVTVENCRVGGGAVAGISLNGSSGNTIVGNTPSGTSNGILLFNGSSNNTIQRNDTSGNHDYGIFLADGSNSNTVAGNVANAMQYSGIFLFRVSHNTLTANVANGNGGAPVGPLDAGQGFYLYQAHDTVLEGNSATGNVSDGFQLRFSNGNTLRNDDGSRNGENGIGLWDTSAKTTIDHATVNGNSYDGIAVFTAPSTTVSNSIGNGNYAYTVDDVFSDGLTCIGNTGNDNTYGGFFAFRASGLTYTNNTAMRNGGAPVGPLDQGEGFYLYETDNVTMSGNLAVDNDTDGFQLRGATHTQITNNKSLSNQRIGIGLFESAPGTFSTGNTISANLARGNKVADTQDTAPPGANTWS